MAMKDQWVVDFVPGQSYVTHMFVAEIPVTRQTKSSKDYLCLSLQDKTGSIESRVWKIPPGLVLARGSFVKVDGEVGEWQEKLQFNVNQIRIASPDEFELGDFFERSEREPQEMWDELSEIVESNYPNSSYISPGGPHGSPYLSVAMWVAKTYQKWFMQAPAAKTIHHNYIGGLLEHVLSLCNAAIPISRKYGLRLDLMLATCILHDAGKMFELDYAMGIKYTASGSLIGHISMGMEMVCDAVRSLEDSSAWSGGEVEKMELLHMVASHHGLLEYGSPKIPMMREALAFHILDLLDSKMAICDRYLRGKVTDGFTEWSKELGGPLYAGVREAS